MKKITKNDFNLIERQMFNRARDIDVAIFNALFSEMPKDYVLDAISMYQNKDGGFGNALEIDNYNPHSTPFQTNEALRILKMVGFSNIKETQLLEKMLNKAFNYLYNRYELVNNKWLFADKENNKYACASWHQYNDDKIDFNNYNPTASILGYTVFFCDEKSPYYKKALSKIEQCLNDFFIREVHEKHELGAFLTLFECLKARGLYKERYAEFEKKYYKDAMSIVERDTNNFSNNYPNMPLDLFPYGWGDSEVQELIEANLDYLIDSRANHGLWEANFRWGNSYPEEESALLKWMGVITIANLSFLKYFGRME